ncbi:ATP-binding protein [Candidatus Symbiothrix dinenymphae]|uniref:ATP-binding protein n=1 Tax=Candidatus Symbiothrix dinenymphae TaxID=467085 RepID=UPI001D058ED7|nr:ATP-binding protein [Candidatus Symbiothrix dinenymphae]
MKRANSVTKNEVKVSNSVTKNEVKVSNSVMKNEVKYFKRLIDSDLRDWSKDSKHKPLLLRGARQVGKSSAVRNLGQKFPHFLEINFERNAEARQIFEEGNLSPQYLCEKLTAAFDVPIEAGRTLLFLDEIQSCLPAISSLRFFCEDFPELHVVAAGSLLEFAIEEIPSFGVGRIRSLFMYPFSFTEFLQANGNTGLLNAIKKANIENPLDDVLHNKALYLLKLFLLIGGMPETVASYVTEKNLLKCQRVLDDLIVSLRNDFAKYKKRVPTLQISAALDSIVRQMGNKFVYTDKEQFFSTFQIKHAAELLAMAGLVVPATHTSANGLPLGSEINPKFRKMFLLDTGVFQRLLGLKLSDILLNDDFDTINKGGIAEMFVGMELLKAASCYEQTQLFYWTREERNSRAEVDFVVQVGDKIIPIEVKSGKTGKMQSMWQFLKEKQSEYGIRTSLENFATYDNIRVYPLYAIANILT